MAMTASIIANEGDVFGRLKVLVLRAANKSGAYYHLCLCDCGKEKLIMSSNLTRGKSKSCGCLSKEITSARASTHGKSKSAEYATWSRIWARCTNPRLERWEQYGGRGIKVSEEWRDFERFYEDMGDRPSSKHSIGRIDNDGGYCKENCRWETAIEQGSNTSRNVFIEHDGARLTIAQWSRKLGMDYSVIIQRYRSGFPTDQIFQGGNLKTRPITVGDVTKLVTGWMKDIPIPISSFYHFKRKGLSDEEIVRRYLKDPKASE